MYRTLGTRGSVFGVASGPYAGRERVVSFARLSPAAKARLIDALAGRGQLAPILRSSGARRSLAFGARLVMVAGAYALFARGWPAAQGAPFAAGYIACALLFAWSAHDRAHALVHNGTKISAGVYLFPLDVIEAHRDGSLRLVPLGGVREAGISHEGSRPSLLLTFANGTTRTFPVKNEREAEKAYAALESAQRTLEKLTYGRDLADAVNLDPFFEVRIDDTWESVSLRPRHTDRLRTASIFAVAVALGLGLFFARNALSRRAHNAERANLDAEIAARRERLAEDDRERVEANRRAAAYASATLASGGADGAAAAGLSKYESIAPNRRMAKLVADLVAHASETGQGLPVYFEHTGKACGVHEGCTAPPQASLPAMERTVVQAFARVMSETVPRSLLPIFIVQTRPDPPSLVVEVAIATVGATPQAIAMTFDVTLRPMGHADDVTFRLTMPPPAMPLAHLREQSIFSLGDEPSDADLVYARGLDRLYDEIYGLFFSGPPRVPEPSGAELRRTFGVPEESR